MEAFLEFLARVAAAIGRRLWPFRYLRITDSNPVRLTIESNSGTFVADARRRVLARNGRVVARFDEIQSVDVVHMHIEEYREHWEVRAYLGPLSRIRIGSSNDDVEASIVAARLSESVNVKVIPWTEAKVVNVEIEL